MSDLWKSAFDRVHAEESLKSHTKEYLQRKVYAPRRSWRPLYGTIAAALCLMVALFVGGYHLYATPAAHIYMDGTVSVTLNLNRFGQVLSAQGYDEAGNALASAEAAVHMDYIDAVAKIIEDKTTVDLENDALTLTVAGNNENWCQQILADMEAYTSAYENIRCLIANGSDAEIIDDSPAAEDRAATDTTGVSHRSDECGDHSGNECSGRHGQ